MEGGGVGVEGRTLRVGNSKKLRKPFNFFDEVNSRKQYLFVVISFKYRIDHGFEINTRDEVESILSKNPWSILFRPCKTDR